MLRLSVDINGRKIGEIGVWNTQEVRLAEDEETIEVRYQIHDMRVGTEEYVHDYPQIGEVWYDRDAGAAKLTQIVMNEVGDDLEFA